MLTFGSLFSGLGGIDLGLERAGMRCKWQVENDDYANKILEKHWPAVPRYRDVRWFLGGKRWRRCRTAWYVDVVAGGPPCQPVSCAGRRRGQEDERWLWPEMARIVRLLRPRYVIVENVPGLLVRGMGDILGDLAALGYDAEWTLLPAAAFGAPHLRWRVFVIAYQPQRGKKQLPARQIPEGQRDTVSVGRCNGSVASDTCPDFESRACGVGSNSQQELPTVERSGTPADASGNGIHQQRRGLGGQGGEGTVQLDGDGTVQSLAEPAGFFSGQLRRQQLQAFCEETRHLYWADAEPDIRRGYDGFASWLDKTGLIFESHKRIMEYGNTNKITSGKKMSQLWRDFREGIQPCGTLRRFQRFSSEEVLLTYVRKLEEIGIKQGWLSLPSQKADRDEVRSLRMEEEPSRPPRRSKFKEQRFIEHSDALYSLSRLVAQDSDEAWTTYCRENATTLAGLNIGGLDGISPTTAVGEVPKRADRLRCLGNAVLPQIAEFLGRLVIEHEAKSR